MFTEHCTGINIFGVQFKRCLQRFGCDVFPTAREASLDLVQCPAQIDGRRARSGEGLDYRRAEITRGFIVFAAKAKIHAESSGYAY